MKSFNKYSSMFIIIVILSSGLMGCKNNVERVQDYLSSDEYYKAIKKVDRLTKEEEINEADDLIKNEIANIRNRYIEGEIDGTLAISEIEKLRSSNRTGINNAIDSTKENIHMMMNSKKAFDDGVRFEEEGNYKDALESYHFVSEDDTDNYGESLNRIGSLITKLKEEEVLSVVETHVIVTSATHKSIYPDQLQLILKNNGESIIKKIKVTIFAYDENDNSVKIKSSMAEDYMFIGLGEGININPGQTWGYEYAWTIENDNIKRIEACVQQAEYEDGSVWDNPLHTEWVRMHWVE